MTAYPTDLAYNDMDGDGNKDIIVRGAAEETAATLILLGRGDGSFMDYSTYSASEAGYFAAADLNHDSYLDLVTGNWNTKVQVVFNNGAGGFGSGQLFDRFRPDEGTHLARRHQFGLST